MLSALRENIARKGNNSYYYAHGSKIDGPQWDGKEEPRLLSVSAVPASPSIKLSLAFESYAWADEKRAVKLYIDFADAGAVLDEDIMLSSTHNSVDFAVCRGGSVYRLALEPLNNEIVSATYKKKDSSFVVALKKGEETTWFALKK